MGRQIHVSFLQAALAANKQPTCLETVKWWTVKRLDFKSQEVPGFVFFVGEIFNLKLTFYRAFSRSNMSSNSIQHLRSNLCTVPTFGVEITAMVHLGQHVVNRRVIWLVPGLQGCSFAFAWPWTALTPVAAWSSISGAWRVDETDETMLEQCTRSRCFFSILKFLPVSLHLLPEFLGEVDVLIGIAQRRCRLRWISGWKLWSEIASWG